MAPRFPQDGRNPLVQYQLLGHHAQTILGHYRPLEWCFWSSCHPWWGTITGLQLFSFWIQLAVGVGLFVGLVIGAVKSVRGFQKWRHRRHTQEVAQEVKETLVADDIFKHLATAALNELMPNGGKSLKDSVNRLEVHAEAVDTRLDSLDGKMDLLIALQQKK